MRAFALPLSVALAFLLGSQAATAEEIVGVASVRDGDTIEIRGKRIRLQGIDAPETVQLCQVNNKPVRCGRIAAIALSNMAHGKVVTCRLDGEDRHKRPLAVCLLGDLELNRWLVRQGHAVAYRQYSTAYVADEALAKKEKLGIWASGFILPWEWRIQRFSQSQTKEEVSGPCRIKGNITRKGEKIYHLPKGRFYRKTTIDTFKGERWFCKPEEALEAGWRPSKE